MIYLVLLVFFILFLIIMSSVKLDIKRCDVKNIDKKIKKKITANVGLYLFGKVKIFSIQVTDKMLRKMKPKKMVKVDMKKIKETIKLIKKLDMQFEKFNLKLKIGNDNAIFTSYTVMAISTGLAFLLNNNKPQNIHYEIIPSFENANVIQLHLSCVLSIKVIHILVAVIVLIKDRRYY